jgi:hypothetical protein
MTEENIQYIFRKFIQFLCALCILLAINVNGEILASSVFCSCLAMCLIDTFRYVFRKKLK